MKCTDCDYFDGSECEYEDIEDVGCPFEEQGENKVDQETGIMTVSIDLSDMQARVETVFKNSISDIVNSAVLRIIKSEYEDRIRKTTTQAIEDLISKKVSEFMDQPIQIGGGWHEEPRSLSRNEFLAETIEKKLEGNFDKEKLSDMVASSIKREVKEFSDTTKHEINQKISNMFDASMRSNLTDSIVSMLMSNETYQKLNGSMKQLIGNSQH